MSITDEQYKVAARKAYATGDVATARSLLARISTYNPEAAPAASTPTPTPTPTPTVSPPEVSAPAPAPAPLARAPEGYLQDRGPGPTGRIAPELYDMGAIGRRPDAQPGFDGRGGEGAPPAPSVFDNEGGVALAKRRGQQVVKGATAVAAAVPESFAIAKSGVKATEVAGAKSFKAARQVEIDRIKETLADETIRPETRAIFEKKLADLTIGQGVLDEVAAQPVVAAKDQPEYAYGDKIRKASEDVFGAPDPRDTTFWAKLAEGGGNMVALAATAVLPGGAGVTLATGAGLGAAQNSASMYKEAIDAGATEEVAQRAAKYGALIGSSEIIPISRALKILPSGWGPKITNKVMEKFAHVAESAGEEAAQEYLSQVANNITAQQLYDPKRGWTEGATEAALIGAVLGGGMGAAGSVGEGGVVQVSGVPPDAKAALDINLPPSNPPDAQTVAPVQGTPTPNKDVAPEVAAALKATRTEIARGVVQRARADQAARAPTAPPAPDAAPLAPGLPPEVSPPVSEAPTQPAPELATDAAPVVAPVADQPVQEETPVAPPALAQDTPVQDTPAAEGDTLETVPEAPATIEQQNAALLDRKNPRKAVYIPYENETATAPFGAGIVSMPLDGGMLYYHTGKGIGTKGITQLIKNGQLGRVLGLGPITKADAMKSAAAGNPEVAVTERTPDGLEVKAAAGTTETAPVQVAALEAEKTPGNTVQVESAAKVLSDRLAANQVAAPVEAPATEAPAKAPAAARVKAVVQSKAAKAAEKLAAIEAEKKQQTAEAEAARIERLKAFGSDKLKDIAEKGGTTSKRAVVVEQTPEERAKIDEAQAKLDARRAAEAKRQTEIEKKVVAGEKAASRETMFERANNGEFATAAEEFAARADPMSKNPARDATRAANATASEALLKDMAPSQRETFNNARDIPVIKARIAATVAEANKRKIQSPKSLEKTHTNSQVWLAQMRLMNRKLNTLNSASASARQDIMVELTEFLVNENTYLKTGNATDLRESRLLEGQQANAPSSGSADKVGARAASDEDIGQFEASAGEALATEEETAQSAEDIIDEVRAAPRLAPRTASSVTSGVSTPVDDGTPAFTAGVNKTAPVEVRKAKPKVLNKPKISAFRKQSAVEEPASGIPAQGGFFTLSPPFVTVSKEDARNAEADVAERKKNGSTDPWGEYFKELTDSGAELSDYASHVSDLQTWQDNTFGDPAFDTGVDIHTNSGSISSWILPPILNNIARVSGDTKVMVLPDTAFDMIMGDRVTDAVYLYDNDTILIPEREFANIGSDPQKFMELLVHESTHAAFSHALDTDPQLEADVQGLLDATKSAAERTKDKRFAYAFTNPHEFIAEALSNRAFQEFLETIPVPKTVSAKLDATLKQRGVAAVSNVFQWIKDKVAEIVGIRAATERYGFDPVESIFESVADVADYLVRVAPKSRTEAKAIAKHPRLRKEDQHVTEMVNRGLSPAAARDIAAFIRDELDGNVTAEEMDAIAQALRDQTLDAVAEAAPVISAPTDAAYQAPKPPVPPPVPPRIAAAVAAAENPKNFGKFSILRRRLMKLQTLDYIARRYGAAFKDKVGNAILDYTNATLSYGPTKARVEQLHNKDFADFGDLRRRKPQEAAKMSELATALAPLDLDLRPGAANSHLSKDGWRDVQDKHQLPILRAKFDAMEPETQKLFIRMTDNYRETHNNAIRGVTYNLLALLDKRLSNDQVIRLMEATVEGKLTDEDAAEIGNETLTNTLRNTKELRTRKGMYFPSTRFGNLVVKTEMTIKDPGVTSAVTRGSKVTVPIRTEIADKKVMFSFNHEVKGARPAVRKLVREWAAAHELPMQTFLTKYRDRKTGKIVAAGEQRTDREYDLVYEITLQTSGVHFFENQNEAEIFKAQALKDFKNGILSKSPYGPVARRENGNAGQILGTKTTRQVMKEFDRADIKEHQKAQVQALLEEIIAQQLPGNRYEHRLVSRKNVLGASKELGRAAAHYGRAAGNYIASIETGPARREALDRMATLAENATGGAEAAMSQVMNEINSRELTVGGPEYTNQYVNDVMTLGQLNLLLSPMNWLLNATQPLMSTLPLLGGRHGVARTSVALTAAYAKIGTIGTVARGVRNTAVAVTRGGKYSLDTTNLVSSIRKNLGPKYAELMDVLVDGGEISDAAVIENAADLSAGRGKWGTGLAKVDRVSRQMPQTVEAVSRAVTAVAAYDLARSQGKMSHKDAITYAVDTVRSTQGRYDAANAPAWMQNAGFAKFFLVFKKYAQLQYQLYGDMLYRAFKGDGYKERAVAFKQVMALTGVNFLAAGAWGLPGMEAVKVVAMLAGAMGLGGGWDKEEDKLRTAVTKSEGKTWGQIVNSGLLSYVTGIDFSSRMGWKDMVTGYAPRELNKDGLYSYIGQAAAGAPGSMIVDMFQAATALSEGKLAKALELAVPVKLFSDTTKAVAGYDSGKLSGSDAVKQALGARSLRQSDISRATGMSIRANKDKTDARKRLENAYTNAITPEDVAAARAGIQAYNRKIGSGRPIGLSTLEKYRRNNLAALQE